MSGLGARESDAIRKLFAGLENVVAVRLDVGPVATPVTLLAAGGRELDPVGQTRALLEEVCALSDRVSLDVAEHDRPGDYPTTTIADGIAYTGLPWGYELEASEFPARADAHGVFSVPAVVVNGRAAWAGNVPEQAFVERLLEAVARP